MDNIIDVLEEVLEENLEELCNRYIIYGCHCCENDYTRMKEEILAEFIARIDETI